MANDRQKLVAGRMMEDIKENAHCPIHGAMQIFKNIAENIAGQIAESDLEAANLYLKINLAISVSLADQMCDGYESKTAAAHAAILDAIEIMEENMNITMADGSTFYQPTNGTTH